MEEGEGSTQLALLSATTCVAAMWLCPPRVLLTEYNSYSRAELCSSHVPAGLQPGGQRQPRQRNHTHRWLRKAPPPALPHHHALHLNAPWPAQATSSARGRPQWAGSRRPPWLCPARC